MKIIIAILIFSLIIIFHELGHFLLAKKNGICVNEFCLGLGPTIIGVTKGETKYSLKLLPFGGACMMLGEDEDSQDERAFGSKSVWARISVVAAGPIFNFILAFVFALFIIGGIGYDAPIIGGVLDGYSAQEAGMQKGDKIIKMGSDKIHVYREITMFTQFNSDKTIDVIYERDGERYNITLTAALDEETGRYLFGFQGSTGRQKGSAVETIKYGWYEVEFWIETTLKSLKMLVTGQVSLNDLSGPVGVVNIIGDTYEESKSEGVYITWINMLNISILLSANIGVMNLLPIPALDGGRLLFLVIEAIRGKRFDPQKENIVNMVGFALLMLLMVVVMFNDIRNIIF